MLRGSVIVLALALCGPILWQSFMDQTISVQAALVRFLITVPIAAILLALLRSAAKKNDSHKR
jgi:hypothetical protein